MHCLVFSSIIFESFGTAWEAHHSAPAGAQTHVLAWCVGSDYSLRAMTETGRLEIAIWLQIAVCAKTRSKTALSRPLPDAVLTAAVVSSGCSRLVRQNAAFENTSGCPIQLTAAERLTSTSRFIVSYPCLGAAARRQCPFARQGRILDFHLELKKRSHLALIP